MTQYGHVIVGGKPYINQWAQPGKRYRQVNCIICEDSGELRDDDGNPEGPCDCRTGDARREAEANR